MQPSLYAKLKAKAVESGKSVNEIANSILEESFSEME
jgi:predicted HicB family RNase H-like nuclease